MIGEAAVFAERAHRGVFRKGTDIPYITHPMEAAVIVSAFTDDEEMIAAALLHDVMEDAGVTREELEQAKKSLEKREIALNEAGSIAVAALQINGVFEAAQAASQQYIENIRSLSDRQAAICAQRDVENRVEVERKLKEAEEKCAAMEYASKRKCEAMEQEAKQKSEAYWTEVSRRLQSFYENHRELKRLLDFGTPGAQF